MSRKFPRANTRAFLKPRNLSQDRPFLYYPRGIRFGDVDGVIYPLYFDMTGFLRRPIVATMHTQSYYPFKFVLNREYDLQFQTWAREHESKNVYLHWPPGRAVWKTIPIPLPSGGTIGSIYLTTLSYFVPETEADTPLVDGQVKVPELYVSPVHSSGIAGLFCTPNHAVIPDLPLDKFESSYFLLIRIIDGFTTMDDSSYLNAFDTYMSQLRPYFLSRVEEFAYFKCVTYFPNAPNPDLNGEAVMYYNQYKTICQAFVDGTGSGPNYSFTRKTYNNTALYEEIPPSSEGDLPTYLPLTDDMAALAKSIFSTELETFKDEVASFES